MKRKVRDEFQQYALLTAIVSVAFLLLALVALAAVGPWQYVAGTNCNTSGDNKCISRVGVDEKVYAALYEYDVDSSLLWDGAENSLFDFGDYASPYAMLSPAGLGDWPSLDFQVVGFDTANLCDGLTLQQCLDTEGVRVNVCGVYPGGVYAEFTSITRSCLEGSGSTEPTATTTPSNVDRSLAFGIGILVVVAGYWITKEIYTGTLN